MALDRKLARWTEAGLISREQAESIRAFETGQGKTSLVYALAGLAGLAMAIGCVSIVAANWDVVPGRMKLGIDLCVMAVLGYGVVRLRERGPGWLADAASVVLYGLTLASIALVGQVYQLGGDPVAALGFWSLCTFPLMSLGQSRGIALIWLLGLQTTYGFALTKLDVLHTRFDGLALAATGFAPLGALLIGRSVRVRSRRPLLAVVAERLGWAEWLILASAGTLGFYDRPSAGDEPWFLVGSALSFAGVLWLARGLDASDPGARTSRWLLLGAWAAAYVPLSLPHGNIPLAAALSFIALWYLVALTAYRSGQRWTLNYATAAIGVRLLIVYFEVFGSLLDTGLGLVTGGLLTLLLIWLWSRRRRAFERGSQVLAAREVPK
jgi:uncharacterized membrane protein